MPKLPPADRKPASVFDRLRAVLTGGDPTVADLERAANDAAQARDEVFAAKAQLEAKKADMALAPDAERAAYRTRLAEATDQAETLAVVADRIAGRLAEARAAEEQSRRQSLYAEAQAKAAEAIRTFRRDYEAGAAKITGVLRAFAEAQIAVNEANAMLPAGVELLSDVEMSARGNPGLPRKVLRETEVSLWCFASSGLPVADEAQQRVVDGGRGRGYLPPAHDGSLRVAGNVAVVLRQFRRVEFLPPVFPEFPDRLAIAVNLPGLYRPAFNAAHGVSHAAVIEATRAAPVLPAPPANRTPQVEMIALSDGDGVIADEAA